MKRLSTILLLVAVSLSVTSCTMLEDLSDWFFGKKSHRKEQPAYKPHEVRIYSNAYDGFVNVRDAPTTKSTVLGKLRNGEDYLVQVGAEGNWIAVKWHGMTGFVNKSVVGKNPWKPVYLGVDGDWIQGIYTNSYVCYLIFNNGKYMHEHQYGDMEYGTWRFEGNEIVFTTKYVTEHGKSFDYYIGKETRETVDVAGQKIGGLAKRPYMTPREFDEYMAGECTTDAGSYSREEFNSAKKIVNKRVSLK